MPSLNGQKVLEDFLKEAVSLLFVAHLLVYSYSFKVQSPVSSQ